MKATLAAASIALLTLKVYAGEAESKLIEAAFNLDVVAVESLLKAGADPNAKYGKYDENVFSNPWDLGYSAIGSQNWTALLAVASASEWPPPPRKIENTNEDFEYRLREAAKVPEKDLEKRRELKLKIGKILIESGADVNVTDGHGATPLYVSAASKSGLLLLLVQHGARVNTKTGAYIDGPSDETPLHLAIHSPDNLAILIHEGAALDAVDTDGNTALHSAVQADLLSSVKLLLDGGADRTIRNTNGMIAEDLCNTNKWATVKELGISSLFTKKQQKQNKAQMEPPRKPSD